MESGSGRERPDHCDAVAERHVILGATGDLTRRKLLPALCDLGKQGLLGSHFAILGIGRKADQDDAGFRRWARQSLEQAGFSPDDTRRWCDECLHYQHVGQGAAQDYVTLGDRITALEREHDLPGNRTFYLAQPPGAFPSSITGLGEAGLNRSRGWTRLIIEKPFGRDLVSARELNELAHQYFAEGQLYRIDHYLGKETVQNLFVFRFANTIFESLWNRDRVESVQITVAESLGIEQRAGYYEQAGALRDMVQNHVTQLVSLIGMEVPAAFNADAVRYEKVKLLGAVVRSWLLDLTARALAEDPTLEKIAPHVADSGEGRWTVFEAIELDVPAPVASLSLIQRLRSRDSEAYSDRLLAALRSQFGGHAIKRED